MAKSAELPKLFRVKEVAEMLSCREGHVWTMIYARQIESVIVGTRSRRIPLSAVNEMIERGRVPIRNVEGEVA